MRQCRSCEVTTVDALTGNLFVSIVTTASKPHSSNELRECGRSSRHGTGCLSRLQHRMTSSKTFSTRMIWSKTLASYAAASDYKQSRRGLAVPKPLSAHFSQQSPPVLRPCVGSGRTTPGGGLGFRQRNSSQPEHSRFCPSIMLVVWNGAYEPEASRASYAVQH